MSGEPPKYFNDHFGYLPFFWIGPREKTYAEMEEDAKRRSAKML